jgi:hypothetical protein
MGFDAPTMANNVNINVKTLRNREIFMLGDVGMQSDSGEGGQVLGGWKNSKRHLMSA